MHVGDYGTVLTYQLREMGTGAIIDLTTMVSCSLVFTTPGDSTVTKTATKKNPPGTDGRVTYTMEQGLLTTAGFWKVKAVVVFPSSRWTSSIDMFEVEA